MDIDTTMALVPVQGFLQTTLSIASKEIGPYNNHNHHHGKIVSAAYHPNRACSAYGRLGKELEGSLSLGNNINMYI